MLRRVRRKVSNDVNVFKIISCEAYRGKKLGALNYLSTIPTIKHSNNKYKKCGYNIRYK